VADKKAYLSLDQILDAQDVLYDDVEVPEWGGSVRVRGLTAEEKNSIAKEARDPSVRNKLAIDTDRAQFTVVQLGLVEPRIGKENFQAIMAKNAAPIERIYRRIMQLSGEDLSEIEEAAERDFQLT